jgi:glycosyltransferase involved in cell wall biosynthesis
MDITVILCTYNRCENLASALESVAASQMPDSVLWEVLVVDNNSKDKTRQVVEEFVSRFPGRFRYAFESRSGKSNALNMAIQNSQAPILAFMDDDVQVEPDWLQKLTGIFQNPAYIGVGGRIFPEKSFILQPWLDPSIPYALAPLAMFDLGPEPGELNEPPFGTNMAFRREAFARYGDFRRDLGPQPGSEIRSEDTEFGMRLLLAGERLWYEPAAVVYHAVSKQRVKQSYFLNWWYGKGRGDVREGLFEGEKRWSLFGIPLVLLRRIAVWSLRGLLSFRRSRRFNCKVKIWWLAGGIRESFGTRRMHRDPGVSQTQGTP